MNTYDPRCNNMYGFVRHAIERTCVALQRFATSGNMFVPHGADVRHARISTGLAQDIINDDHSQNSNDHR